MKKIGKGIGAALMFLGGVGVVSLIISLPSYLFSDEASFMGAVAMLLTAGIFAGLFWLGLSLRKQASGKAEGQPPAGAARTAQAPSPSARREAPKAPEAANAADFHWPASVPAQGAAQASAPEPKPTPVPARAAAQVPAPAPKPRPRPAANAAPTIPPMTREGRLSLYTRDPEAPGAAPEEAWLEFREGVPFLFRRTGQETESFELPEEMRAGLKPEDLEKWLKRILGKGCPVDWTDYNSRISLRAWCDMERGYARQELPDCVYPIENPFSFLDHVGEDGLSDRSGVRRWVALKKGAKISDAARALARMEAKGTTVVLLKGQDPTGALPRLSLEDRLLCAESHVWIGFLTAGDRIKNAVDCREYEVNYEEWPGSADDAATYGNWWFDELPPSDDARLFAMIRRIVSECRALGVSEERIRGLLRDGLCLESNDTCSQLTYSGETGAFVVLYWEKGQSQAVVVNRDEDGFCFEFLRSFVYHCPYLNPGMRPEQRESLKNLLKDTKEKYGDTEAYRQALAVWREAGGDVSQLQ